ncbi:MAG: TolC family protein [Sphingobium sp.]
MARVACRTAAAMLLAALPVAAPAQGTSGQCLAVIPAIVAAATGDPRVGQALAGADRSRAELRIARGAYLPSLSAFNRVGTGVDSFRAESQLDNRAGLRASQLVFDFGQTDARRAAARARLTGAEERADQQRLDVAAEAAQRHFGIARAEDRVAAAQGMTTYYTRQTGTVDDQLQVGLLKRSEAAAIRAEAARAAASEAEEKLNAEQERTALQTLVQKPVPCVDRQSAAAYVGGTLPSALPDVIAVALDRSPELRSATAAARAAELDVKQEMRSHLPEVSLSGTATYDYGFEGAPSARASRIGIDVAMPLLQGGQLAGQTQARQADARAASFELEGRRRRLIENVTLSWTRAERLQEVARLQQQAADAAAVQATALGEEFDARLVTLDELIDARRNEYQLRLASIDALYQWRVERLNLLIYTGQMEDMLAAEAARP